MAAVGGGLVDFVGVDLYGVGSGFPSRELDEFDVVGVVQPSVVVRVIDCPAGRGDGEVEVVDEGFGGAGSAGIVLPDKGQDVSPGVGFGDDDVGGEIFIRGRQFVGGEDEKVAGTGFEGVVEIDVPESLGAVGAGGDFLGGASAVLAGGHVAGAVDEEGLHEGRHGFVDAFAVHQPLADESHGTGSERGGHAGPSHIDIVRVGPDNPPARVRTGSAADGDDVGSGGDDVGLEAAVGGRTAAGTCRDSLRGGGLGNGIVFDGIDGVSGNP